MVLDLGDKITIIWVCIKDMICILLKRIGKMAKKFLFECKIFFNFGDKDDFSPLRFCLKLRKTEKEGKDGYSPK